MGTNWNASVFAHLEEAPKGGNTSQHGSKVLCCVGRQLKQVSLPSEHAESSEASCLSVVHFSGKECYPVQEPHSVAEARDRLARAVKQAEQNLLDRLAAGQGRQSLGADPFTALVALATHTGFVVEGGAIQVSVGELMQVMQFIATDPRYQPDPRFPFTKAQLAASLREEDAH
jgi:hypothetical protein